MTIFGIGPLELLVIVVIALVVVGPERLPEMLYQLGQGVAKMKNMVVDLRNQARSELGDDYETFENMGRQLRELDPRRQIQEFSRALLDDVNPPPPGELTVEEMLAASTTPPPLVSVPLPQPEARLLAQSLLNDDLLEQPIGEAFNPLENLPND